MADLLGDRSQDVVERERLARHPGVELKHDAPRSQAADGGSETRLLGLLGQDGRAGCDQPIPQLVEFLLVLNLETHVIHPGAIGSDQLQLMPLLVGCQIGRLGRLLGDHEPQRASGVVNRPVEVGDLQRHVSYVHRHRRCPFLASGCEF
jgi:hypothetical protein